MLIVKQQECWDKSCVIDRHVIQQ